MDFPSGNRETDRQTDRPGLVLLPLSPINTHEFMWVVRQKAKVKTSWRPLSAWWRRRRSDEECLSLSWWGWWFDEELEVKTMKSSAVVHVSVCLCSLRSLSKLFPDVFNPQTFFYSVGCLLGRVPFRNQQHLQPVLVSLLHCYFIVSFYVRQFRFW